MRRLSSLSLVTALISSWFTDKVAIIANLPKRLIYSQIRHRLRLLTKTSAFAFNCVRIVKPPTSPIYCCQKIKASLGRHTLMTSLSSTLSAAATSIFTTTLKIKCELWSSETMPISESAQNSKTSHRLKMTMNRAGTSWFRKSVLTRTSS